MKRLIAILPLALTLATGATQAGFDSLMQAVRVNNPSLRSQAQYWAARRTELKTGLTPYDPIVEYDYLYGTPAIGGNQRDFAVTQRLDFPTVYSRKKTLSDMAIAQTASHEAAQRQEILLEAQSFLLEATYLNKQANALQRRLDNAQAILDGLAAKLDKGGATQLDVNKARLRVTELQHALALNESARRSVMTLLSGIAGGVPVAYPDTLYPDMPALSPFDSLFASAEATDPMLGILREEEAIRSQQITVEKALSMPKIEAGYHAQGILGQSYKGFHAGVTVPLWENKNRVNAAEAEAVHASAQLAEQRMRMRAEYQRLYDQVVIREKTLADYREALRLHHPAALLRKALDLGQIDVIQYFNEEAAYFEAHERFLETEWAYHQDGARLFRFRL